jgi:tetratricopeptide (TPR) repeat protein
MSRHAKVLASLIGLSLIVAAPVVPVASAGDKPGAASSSKPEPPKLTPKQLAEAKQLFNEGVALYGKGSYEEAIAAWEKSYEISKKDLIFESIANAYERLGQPGRAREYLGRWREAAPPEELPELDERIHKLDARIAKDKAEKEKAEQAQREAEEKRQAELRAAEARAAAASKGGGGGGGGGLFVPGLVLAGVGAGIAVAGGALDIVASTRRPDAGQVCAPLGDKQLCRTSAKGDIESSNGLAIGGDIALIGGTVVAAAGVVLVVTLSGGAKKGKEDKKAAVAPLFLPGGGGAAVIGRF